MRFWVCGAMLIVAPVVAQAQFTPIGVFYGCEETGRSCHRVTARVYPENPAEPLGLQRLSFFGESWFSTRGAIRACPGLDCGFSVNLPWTAGAAPADLSHLYTTFTTCRANGDLPISPSPLFDPVLGALFYCRPGDEVYTWVTRPYERTPFDYRPTRFSLNVVYQEAPGSTYSYRTIPLTVVPEPTTWAMVSAGLLALGFAHRRARTRTLATRRHQYQPGTDTASLAPPATASSTRLRAPGTARFRSMTAGPPACSPAESRSTAGR